MYGYQPFSKDTILSFKKISVGTKYRSPNLINLFFKKKERTKKRFSDFSSFTKKMCNNVTSDPV